MGVSQNGGPNQSLVLLVIVGVSNPKGSILATVTCTEEKDNTQVLRLCFVCFLVGKKLMRLARGWDMREVQDLECRIYA